MVRRPNFAKLGQESGHRAITPTQVVCFSVRIYCCIFKRERLKVEWCWKRRHISHFLTTPPVKNSERGGRDLYIVEALPTTEPPKYIWWPSTAWLLSAMDWEKKKGRKESSWKRPSRLTSSGLTSGYVYFWVKSASFVAW